MTITFPISQSRQRPKPNLRHLILSRKLKMCQCIYQLGAFVNRSEGGESVKATFSEKNSDLNESYPYITGENLRRVKANFMNLY